MTTFPADVKSPVTIAWLVDHVGEPILDLSGDPQSVVRSVASFEAAQTGTMVFYKDKRARARDTILSSPATAVIAAIGGVERDHGCVVHVAEPTRWFVRALRLLFPTDAKPAIHATASISPSSRLHGSVSIGAHCVIGDNVSIGRGSRLDHGVIVEAGCEIGSDCIIGANSVVGGQGLAMVGETDGSLLAFPHLGSVKIGDRVEIGAQCCLVRGILQDTIVGNGVKIANLTNIGHNCRIGDDCWISGRVIVCGSAVLEPRVMVGAGAVIYNHLTIGAGARIGLGSVVVRPVAAKTAVFGVPAAVVPFLRDF